MEKYKQRKNRLSAHNPVWGSAVDFRRGARKSRRDKSGKKKKREKGECS